MDLKELRQEAIKIIKENPELKSEIQDLFSLAISEVEEGGSESHECDLAYNDMIELQKEANDNKMLKGGKLTDAQQNKFNKVMNEWKQRKLHSGKNGPIVKDQDQAIAIAYAEAYGMKKMLFGGMINNLSYDTIDRMEGLAPNSELKELLNIAEDIILDMENEGFEKDEVMSFLAYKISEIGQSSLSYYESTKVDENALFILYNELSKAKNIKSLKSGFDKDEGYFIKYESGLKSESDKHEGELESYTFYLDQNNDNLIEAVYDLSGNSASGLTVNEALSASRANEDVKMAQGGGVDKLPANLKKRLDKANSIIVKYNGKPITEAQAIRFNADKMPQSGYDGGLKAFEFSNAKGFYDHATKRDYQTIGDALIDISHKMSGKDIYAKGGVIEEIKRNYQTAGSDSSGVYTYSKRTAEEIARKYDGDVQEDGSNWYVSINSEYAKGGKMTGWKHKSK